MNRAQINTLSFKGIAPAGSVIETHISWVVVSGDYAFKIKKPVKLSFLDFSTLALRKKYCQLELKLNSRWSNIYLSVLPVYYYRGSFIIDGRKGKIVDYAVVMKRLDEKLRMDRLFRQGNVSFYQVKELANMISNVHSTSKVIKRQFSLDYAKELFNDIEHFVQRAGNLIEVRLADTARQAVSWSNQFLESHQRRFKERILSGFQRDVHGDLHSGNIFLDHPPVIFDCIEFNPRYRQIDILYEAAFLAMDMEAFGKMDLAAKFMTQYTNAIQCIQSSEDLKLLLYFKCLRANVRAKVHLIQAVQSTDVSDSKFHAGEASTYIDLMKTYIHREINQSGR